MIYRLKKLIIEKYGEEKFTTGCQIVAQFINLSSRQEWTAEVIESMCETSCSWNIQANDLENLRSLFKLNGIHELYVKHQ